jgi:hypothetical protein
MSVDPDAGRLRVQRVLSVMVTQVDLLSKILALLESSNTNSSPAEKARFLADLLRYRAPGWSFWRGWARLHPIEAFEMQAEQFVGQQRCITHGRCLLLYRSAAVMAAFFVF